MIYILHLDTPLHHARHYVGFSTNKRTLAERIEHHRNGTAGCKFTEALREKGITFTVARVMEGDRMLERKLKRTHKVSPYCPLCNPKPRQYKPKEM